MYKHQRIAWGEERRIFLDLINKEIPNDDNRPTRIIHNGKNGETLVKVFADVENTQVVDSRGIRLTDAEMDELNEKWHSE